MAFSKTYFFRWGELLRVSVRWIQERPFQESTAAAGAGQQYGRIQMPPSMNRTLAEKLRRQCDLQQLSRTVTLPRGYVRLMQRRIPGPSEGTIPSRIDSRAQRAETAGSQFKESYDRLCAKSLSRVAVCHARNTTGPSESRFQDTVGLPSDRIKLSCFLHLDPAINHAREHSLPK